MSVLKYNNNGTWEGLNIDHASTADSALYDADGNVISSTYAKTTDLGLYLPLTAGSSKRLSGNLFLDSSSTQDIYFYQSGTRRAKLEMQSNNGAYIMSKCDTDGNSLVGVDASSSNNLILFANGDEGIVLRPNGMSSSSGRVWLDMSGQFHGGATRKQATGSSTTTISGNNTYNILTLSGLDSTGLYVIQAHCIYKITNTTAQFVWCKFNSFWSESKWIPLQTNWEINHIAIVWGNSSYTFQMSPQGSNNGGTVSSPVINAFQIA